MRSAKNGLRNTIRFVTSLFLNSTLFNLYPTSILRLHLPVPLPRFYSALLSSTQLYSALLSSTQLYSALLYSTLPYSTLLSSPLLYSTLLSTLYSLLSTLCSLLSALCSLLSALCSLLSTLYSLLYSTLLYHLLKSYLVCLYSTSTQVLTGHNDLLG